MLSAYKMSGLITKVDDQQRKGNRGGGGNCVSELHTIVSAPIKNPSSNFEKLII
jgi:hypothetical protein